MKRKFSYIFTTMSLDPNDPSMLQQPRCVQEAMFLPLRNSAWKSRESIPRWFTFEGERISFPRKFHEITPRRNDSLSADCRCETSNVSSDASWARNVENPSRGVHHFNIISGSCVRWGARPTLVDGSLAIKRKSQAYNSTVSLCDWTRNDKLSDETLVQERIWIAAIYRIM